MDDMKHTPGPWAYDHNSGWIDATGCCHRGPMHVADIRGWGHLTGKGHGAHGLSADQSIAIQAANGALVSAAPDYAAGVEQMLAHEQAGGDGWWKGWEMLKAAHAKATISPPTGEGKRG